MDALIGSSGYVGSTLLGQRSFDCRFRSTDIMNFVGGSFRSVVCAGAPAQKWLANRDPTADRANIELLASILGRAAVQRFVLISTVDVFADSRGATEETVTTLDGLSPYGQNRLWLEQFVRSRFVDHLIVRLPGLVGPGLRKNALYDLHHGNNIDVVNPQSIYQFYPMVNLSCDISTAQRSDLRTIHLVAQPISVAEVASSGLGMNLPNDISDQEPASYDLRTRHAALFGGLGDYTYSRRESLLAIRAYAQSEPRIAVAT